MNSAQADALSKSLTGTIVGDWTVREQLGYGKSAVVMRAEKGETNAALKVFHPELIDRYGREVQIQRIARELTLIGSCHANLVGILDGGECPVSKNLFVVMELVPWKTLSEVLQNLPSNRIADVISQVAAAAIFLEEKGLVHRDIKPDNIVINDDFSSVKLLDLGVLRPVGHSDLTDVDQKPFIGTLRYSSPEFLLRQEIDSLDGWRALTFYQLGATLHDLLMKEPLFLEYTTPYSLMVKAILEIRPKVYHDQTRLVELCNHCLVKDPLTRLELVKWSRFSTTAAEEKAADAIRERIKTRQKFASTINVTQVLSISEAQRLSQQILNQLCRSLETKVSICLNALGTFPLRTTVSHLNILKEECSTFITFERDLSLGLDINLAVLFSVKRLNSNVGVGIYRLSAVGAASLHQLAASELTQLYELHAGEEELILDGILFENALLRILEQVYQLLDAGQPTSINDILTIDPREVQ